MTLPFTLHSTPNYIHGPTNSLLSGAYFLKPSYLFKCYFCCLRCYDFPYMSSEILPLPQDLVQVSSCKRQKIYTCKSHFSHENFLAAHDGILYSLLLNVFLFYTYCRVGYLTVCNSCNNSSNVNNN